MDFVTKELWRYLKYLFTNKKCYLGWLLVFTFFLFSFIVAKKSFYQLDFDTTVRIQHKISGKFDTFLSVFSLLGSFELLTLALIALLISKNRLKGLIIMGMYMFGMTVEFLMKNFINHPGPPSFFFRYNIQFLFTSAYVRTSHSYPSGHSYRTVFLATLIIALIWQIRKLGLPRKWFYFLLVVVFCGIMLISRVSLGEHWTTDVIGGSILGLGLGYLASILLI
jgi:membrane-associated phospholipid phosphatase